eukprot:1751071-Pyramimonas_sp.AAC.1
MQKFYAPCAMWQTTEGGGYSPTEVEDRGRLGEGALRFFVIVGCCCASWGRAPSSDLMFGSVLAGGGSLVLER